MQYMLLLKDHLKYHKNAISKLQSRKAELIAHIEFLESLLYKADLHFMEKRKDFIKLMRFYDQ